MRYPGDPGVAAVAASYRSFLEAPHDTFCDWPLDVVVDAFASACETDDERSWIDAFRLRYLDLAASDGL